MNARHLLSPLFACGLLLLACDPPPPTTEEPTTPTADTVVKEITPPPAALSPKDSLALVQGMITDLRTERDQAKQALADAEKRRKALATSTTGPADQRAREIRDASIAIELNKDLLQRAETHLSELEQAKARLEAQVR